MNLQSFKKNFYIVLLIPIAFFTFTYFNATNSSANITPNNQNEYTVDNGNDLFYLLRKDGSYWNSHTLPGNLKINVNKNITLPSATPDLYNFKNTSVNVDFGGNTFYVENIAGSALMITPDNISKLTISNLNIGTSSTNYSVSGVPDSNGNLNKSANYVTYYGMLFAAKYSQSPTTYNCNAQITYNNIHYDVNQNFYYNQPLCTYYVPVNFTGNNYIRTSNNGQQLAEIPNIKVSDGNTTLIGGKNGNFGGAMIYPYENKMFNQTFPINVSENASLNIENNSNSPTFGFLGQSNNVKIENNGNLTLNSLSPISSLFSDGTSGLDFSANTDSSTTFKSINDVFNSKIKSFTGNFDNNSNTIFASQNGSIFQNDFNWKNRSSFNIDAGAKILSYSGNQIFSGKGSNSIPFNFNGSSNLKKFYSAVFPDNINSYDSSTPDNRASYSGSKSSDTIIDNNKSKGFLISSGNITLKNISPLNYSWNYSIDKLKEVPTFLKRTDSNGPLKFDIVDDRNTTPNFRIDAKYTPNQTNQPFSMWFKKDSNDSNATELNSTTKNILNSTDFQKDNDGTYSKSFTNDTGLVIKADNHVKAKNYDGTIDWIFSNDVN